MSFLNAWIYFFGAPLYVVANRVKQFESKLYADRFSQTKNQYTTHKHQITEKHKTTIIARKQILLDAMLIVLLSLWNFPTNLFYSPAVNATNHIEPMDFINEKGNAETGNWITLRIVDILFQNLSYLNFWRNIPMSD